MMTLILETEIVSSLRTNSRCQCTSTLSITCTEDKRGRYVGRKDRSRSPVRRSSMRSRSSRSNSSDSSYSSSSYSSGSRSSRGKHRMSTHNGGCVAILIVLGSEYSMHQLHCQLIIIQSRLNEVCRIVTTFYDTRKH